MIQATKLCSEGAARKKASRPGPRQTCTVDSSCLAVLREMRKARVQQAVTAPEYLTLVEPSKAPPRCRSRTERQEAGLKMQNATLQVKDASTQCVRRRRRKGQLTARMRKSNQSIKRDPKGALLLKTEQSMNHQAPKPVLVLDGRPK